MTDRLSTCCSAPVSVGGKSMTHWYECQKCGQACDVVLAADSIEAKINHWEERLEELGWNRGPCDVWQHPKTGSRYGVMTAIGIAEQEAANK